jgi:uncharacterized integral membrane protein
MTEPPDRPLSPEEPAARRRVTARQFLLFALAVFTVVYVILLVVENRRKVHVDYVFASGDHRLIWLIVISGFLGWLCGMATSFLLRRRTRRAR